MNWSTLSAHERRVLLLGATVIMAMIAAFRGVPAWRAWYLESRSAATERMSAASRDGALLAGFPAALDSLEARTARLVRVRPSLLTGESPSEASSNLAAIIAELARGSSVRLEGVDARIDSSRTNALPRASVDLQATADIAGLAALVRSVENGPVLLTIRRLNVRAQNVASPSDQVELLSLRLTIEGLVLLRRGATTHAGT
jgi:type II secretion system (T2SS) protein M